MTRALSLRISAMPMQHRSLSIYPYGTRFWNNEKLTPQRMLQRTGKSLAEDNAQDRMSITRRTIKTLTTTSSNPLPWNNEDVESTRASLLMIKTLQLPAQR
jgi:hypothetical protein